MPVYKLRLIRTQEVHIDAPSEDDIRNSIMEWMAIGWDADAFDEPDGGNDAPDLKLEYEILGRTESNLVHLEVVDGHVYFTGSPIKPDPAIQN